MYKPILELSALLLSLFCLMDCLGERRAQYAPHLCSPLAGLRTQHGAFLAALLCMLPTSAAAVCLHQGWRFGTGGALILYTLYHAQLCALPCLLALYVLALAGRSQRWSAKHLRLFALPLASVELLLLSNPVHRLCFTVDSFFDCQSGPCFWVLHVVSGFYLLSALFPLLPGQGSLKRWERAAATGLVAVIAAGKVFQGVWGVSVELFFTAVTLFGMLMLLERRDGAVPGKRASITAIIALSLTFFMVIAANITLIRGISRSQSDRIGNTQLDVIRGELQDTITQAETDLLRVSMDVSRMLDDHASREELAAFFDAQRLELLSHNSFMNVYAGGPDWHIVPDFDAPDDFHASERVWYLGAQEHPGEIYITEPYIDANTGAMCFTVSTLLSDGETVVGMDLNFDKAQESIRRMTEGKDQTAMIVTAGGLIVGYSDMSLVGERAEDRLPEYAQVLQRVISSKDHDSFRVRLNDRPCVIFSSETSNRWYLILSVDTDVLYAESDRQMAAMGAINLLMLVVVLTCAVVSARSRQRAAQSVSEGTAFLSGLATQLRQLSARILRLNDQRLHEEGSDPAELAEHLDRAVDQLSTLSENVRSYAALMALQQEPEQPSGVRHKKSSSAPSRTARSGILLTLTISLVIILFFCVRLSANWGVSQLNRDADHYENHLNQWIARQESVLSLFTGLLSAEPELMDDYDKAVRLLDDMAKPHSDIAACYLANPYAEIPVIMSNGWMPDEEDRPEKRPWYRDSLRAPEHVTISAPYQDAKTGNYCITFSQPVYGKNEEFLGVFGVDFYLDSLTRVLGEGYTTQSYAFLVDARGAIVNHPNPDYQMSERVSVSVADTEYADACDREGVCVLRDYSGSLVACLSRKSDSGFTVVVANRWWSIFGSTVWVTLLILFSFGICCAIVILLISRLIRWQEEVNRQLVEAADAAVKAGQAKSQFLAQMSHEIRTPMNAIIGLDTLALQEQELSPRTRDSLEKIGSSARHLLSLINDILDMSRIESGRMELKEQDFVLRELVEQICVIIGGQCADKGLRFHSDTQGNLDAHFIGDDLKLKQSLINILGNCVKFTDAPGTVSFTVTQTPAEDGRSTLTFTMQDTGVGMDKEYLPRLFEAFSQEDSTATNRYGGSGLGMAITKRFLDQMGGTIEIESEKGVGSTFVVTVPLRRGAEAPAPSPAEQEAPAEAFSPAGLHVLVAEDNELNAEILMDLLDMEEITCEWADNGEKAVKLFSDSESGHFDAVLMDMRMPVMDGVTATRTLRSLERSDAKKVPIIALTANAFEDDVHQCLEAGMNTHLSKPVDIDLLIETLGKYCAPKRA